MNTELALLLLQLARGIVENRIRNRGKSDQQVALETDAAIEEELRKSDDLLRRIRQG